MAGRRYQVIVAKTRGGLIQVASSDGWMLLQSTVREFVGFDSNDDNSLGDIGGLVVNESGWVGLAFKES